MKGLAICDLQPDGYRGVCRSNQLADYMTDAKIGGRVTNFLENFVDDESQEMKNEQVIETVKKAFQKELIVIDALATTKKETIAQVSKLLLEQGCLSEDVTEKVFELEERRPTTIGSQIAMAHVYKDSVKKSGIAVMRMKYPVKWSRSSKVKLVFFLAINMEESNEILKLFKYLYALIDNKEDIQKILEANSSEEIYELLMEEFH